MGGVDHYDQMVQYYPLLRRTYKWTRKFMFYLIQMAIFNSFALYKMYALTPRKMALLEYMEHIVEKLLTFTQDEWPTSGVPIYHAPDVPNPRPPYQPRSRCRRVATPATTAATLATTAATPSTTAATLVTTAATLATTAATLTTTAATPATSTASLATTAATPSKTAETPTTTAATLTTTAATPSTTAATPGPSAIPAAARRRHEGGDAPRNKRPRIVIDDNLRLNQALQHNPQTEYPRQSGHPDG
ncbi:hypothetical protein Pmani_017465 [Petrolisthes manimaculis]|uniref:PiggyBac transposable element-derived protein domain-containing protein n=1 Tax=Petrolisthes manimaculis TaxID=1843537 RepID=A0AAE1PLT1_9EUCA|nr:hypothetical protein Pmani_017465 [Petrolisthes manimaculis]